MASSYIDTLSGQAKQNARNWYVYRHIRLDKNTPFYIGIGCKPNYQRAKEGVTSKKRNPIWNRIVEKCDWRYDIICDEMTKEEASEKEKEFIKLYGRLDLGTGNLCNLTDGGDGIWNCIRSAETKAKCRISKVGELNPSYGKKQPQYVCEKKRKSHLEVWQNMPEDVKLKRFEKSSAYAINIQAKPIFVYDGETLEFIAEFRSIRDAILKLGLPPKSSGKIISICKRKGTRRRVRGYTFEYKKNG